MKKFLLTALFLTFVISTLTAQTYTVGNLVYTFNDEGVTLYRHVNGSSASGEIIIPESISINGNNYAVTAIADSAFYDCYSLNGALVIPNTVKTIGNYSFHDCQFTSLTLSNTLLSIGDGAFSNCYLLNGTLTIPESVVNIGEYAFAGCSGFTGNLSIPNSITAINDYTFLGCYGFSSLTLPEFLTSIGEGAFKDCSGFTNTLTLPSSLTNIGEYAFSWCLGFTGDLIIPESITHISAYAFDNCQGFTGKLSLPSTLTYIGDNGFMGCVFFTKVITLATTPPELGVYAFEGLIISTLTVPTGCIPIYQNSDWQLYFDNFISDWNGTHADSYAGGDGSESNPYQIATAEQLALLAYQTNNDLGGNAHYILTDDIYLGGDYMWEPIGKWGYGIQKRFSGVFNGDGHTITEMYIANSYDGNDANNVAGGVFGLTEGATIKNVNVSKSTILKVRWSGLIAGWACNNTKIINCTANGIVNYDEAGIYCLGGIVGRISNDPKKDNDTLIIKNCVNNASVRGIVYQGQEGRAGGIAGDLAAYSGYGLMTECTNYGEVQGYYAGGMAGRGIKDCLFENCTNRLDAYVSGVIVGGIVGSANDGIIMKCANKSEVCGIFESGRNMNHVGGIAGSAKHISNCYNMNNVSHVYYGYTNDSTSVYIGGIVGDISGDCYNVYFRGSLTNMVFPDNVFVYRGKMIGKRADDAICENLYWLGTSEYPAVGYGLIPESACSFHQGATYYKWSLVEPQYGTTDLLEALNYGSRYECLWIDDTEYFNNAMPVFMDYPQNYPLIGSEWYYEITNVNGSVTYQYLECAADTTIGTTRPKVIVKSNTLYDKDLHTKVTHEYVYSEDGIVYWWDKQSQNYTTLYNFNANVGDQWTIHVGTQNITMHVDDVNNVEYNGETYSVLTVSDTNDIFSGDIVCGIGHTTSFFPEKMLNNRDFDVDGMRCYWHFGEELLQFGEVDCDEIYNNYNAIAENDGIGFEVYPNPTNGGITIKIGDNVTFQETSLHTAIEFEITNICGQTLMQGTISSENQLIDISNLENGMYFLKIGYDSIKIIKM